MIKVAVVGGTGYTGVELLRLLAQHPAVSLDVITSRAEVGTPVACMFPSLRGHVDLAFSPPDIERLQECELVFFATPNGTSMTMVRPLFDARVRVIDLAADFRLRSAEVFERWYGLRHRCPDLLEQAVYGLPELNREAIKDAHLVANPGCYPTAVILGLTPLIEARLVRADRLIADAKSGVSGAGRQESVAHLFAEAGDTLKAYSVAGHRHLPEILQALARINGSEADLVFVPHLVPMIRGIHVTLYAELLRREVDIQHVYEERYRREPFIDVLPPGSHPETRSVRGCNTCRIATHRPGQGDRIVVLSVIDNLVKGAAGQAIQNMNLMFGLEETCGLANIGLSP